MLVFVPGARTGRIRAFSTTGLAVVAATVRAVLEPDGTVLGRQGEFLQEREIGVPPIVDHMAWVGAMAHAMNLVVR